jgi:hypothetical protein
VILFTIRDGYESYQEGWMNETIWIFALLGYSLGLLTAMAMLAPKRS